MSDTHTDSEKKYNLKNKKNEDNGEVDPVEYKKLLAKLFPSKYLKQRIKEIEEEYNSDSDYFESEEEDDDYDEDDSEDDSEEDSEEDYDEDESEDLESDLDLDYSSLLKGKKKGFNILLTMNKDGKENIMLDVVDKDKGGDSDSESVAESPHEKSKEKTTKKNYDDENDEIVLKKLQEFTDTLNEEYKCNLLSDARENLKIAQKTIDKEKKKREEREKDVNLKEFRMLLREKNTLNDFGYFRNLDQKEQLRLIESIKEVNAHTDVEKPYKIALLDTDIPSKFKSIAMKKMNTLRYMEPGSNEYYKMKLWVDTFMQIPFNKYSQLPIKFSDGIDKCHEYMEKSKETLNNAVYGLNDAKMQIMQLVGQLIINPDAIGTAIAIKGPMGTGKTTLVKEGVSKILGRDFAFIALGGATDSSVLEGHSYTYEGSTWGKILDILIHSKSMNPVIYFDELDKISDTPKGEEITSILTHLTDTTQNNCFHDKYFSEIEFDLSKCLFIFSYNDEEKVNPILRDRMYRIETKGYDVKQKKTIAKDFLLPKIREQIVFKEDEVIIEDDVIKYIIEKYTNEEDGVRNLKRCLEIVYSKLNLYRLMKSETNLFEEDMSIKVEFPFKVTNDIVDKLIKLDVKDNNKLNSMYM